MSDTPKNYSANADESRFRGTSIIAVASFTIATIGLIGETIVMNWEHWALPVLFFSIIMVWLVHLNPSVSSHRKTFIISGVFYGVAFFHGIHPASIFDSSLLICFIFLIFSLFDEIRVIWIGIGVYAILIFNQVWMMIDNDSSFDQLTVGRLLLHVAIIFLSSQICNASIKGRLATQSLHNANLESMDNINKSMEDFMANLSHNLRTPINAVTGLSNVLLEKETDGEKIEVLNSIMAAGHRLSDQVSDLLDHTELESGRVILDKETYRISSIVTDLISNLRSTGRTDLPEIIINISPSTPASLYGDHGRIKRVIWHMLQNSIHFTQRGAIYFNIYPVKTDYGINLSIDMTDTSDGFTEDMKDVIISDLYTKNPVRESSYGEIGLALSIIYGFVHSMGGFITMESKVGQGTRIHVSIPQEVVDPSPCLEFKDASHLSFAFYFHTEKFDHPMVRDYYDQFIAGMVRDLKTELKRAASILDLKEICRNEHPSHIFIGSDVYEEDIAFFEQITREVHVLVIADNQFAPRVGSHVSVIRKPLNTYHMIRAVNETKKTEATMPLSNKKVFFPGLRVLVVDDEELNLVVATGLFTRYKMRVDTAASGREALDKYNDTEYDVVFLDHMMPEMDGVETLKEMRRMEKNLDRETIITALTANAVSGAKEMFLSAGFDGFLAKPIDIPSFERMMCNLLPTYVVANEPTKGANLSDDTNVFDRSSVLSYCLVDTDLAREICISYSIEASIIAEELETTFREDNYTAYAAKLRSIRDLSKIFGATELYELVKSLDYEVLDEREVPQSLLHKKILDTLALSARYAKNHAEGGASYA